MPAHTAFPAVSIGATFTGDWITICCAAHVPFVAVTVTAVPCATVIVPVVVPDAPPVITAPTVLLSITVADGLLKVTT